MSTPVTLNLPEDVYQRAELWARRNGKPVADVLAETIELSLLPLGFLREKKRPKDWNDEEVLAATDAQMPASDDRRLSELLDRQQAGTISSQESNELLRLMEVYQEGLLRKSEGLREAVRRGLRQPLEP